MRKTITAILVFICSICMSYAQSDSIASKLKECENNVYLDTLSKNIKFPNSENLLHLPNKWSGEFTGELPSLKLKPNKKSTIIGRQVWDTFSVDEFYKTHESESSDLTRFSYFNHEVVILKNKNNLFDLYFHNDNDKKSENRWMWIFTFYSSPLNLNDKLICEINQILKQIIVEYQN